MSRAKYTTQDENYKNKNILGTRLVELRKEKKLTQQGLVEKLQEFLDQDEPMSPLTISAYENGNRLPTLVTLIALSRIFNVSADYLLGIDRIPTLDEKKKAEATATDSVIMPEYDLIIRPQDYEKYDGLAVYITAKSNSPLSIKPQWGKMKYYDKMIVLDLNEYVELSSNLVIYRAKPVTAQFYEKCDMFALTFSSLQNARMVWVEPITQDKEVRTTYRGYYTHNSTRTMLINVQNGNVLPYTGLNITFNAFSVGELKK
jgi:transcriptional regulator with XRE-family HTH domain